LRGKGVTKGRRAESSFGSRSGRAGTIFFGTSFQERKKGKKGSKHKSISGRIQETRKRMDKAEWRWLVQEKTKGGARKGRQIDITRELRLTNTSHCGDFRWLQ